MPDRQVEADFLAELNFEFHDFLSVLNHQRLAVFMIVRSARCIHLGSFSCAIEALLETRRVRVGEDH
jgi:hypothetical protein